MSGEQPKVELSEAMKAYRQWLVQAEQKSQEDFDKTVLSLSGGALGVSFVFLKDVVGVSNVVSTGWLMLAWSCWAASALGVLLSFYFSHLALREAIRQVDSGGIKYVKPGGAYATITKWLNVLGALLFFIGVLCITCFAYKNFGTEKDNVGKETATATATQGANPPAAASNTTR